MTNRHQETISFERNFADSLCNSIHYYWRNRGYNITVSVDSLEHHQHSKPKNAKKRSHSIPVFPIRSNVGLKGYPPKWPE